MIPVHLQVALDAPVADVPPRLFGTFVEHLGRCVYTGIFEPGHASADEHGLRGDVLSLVRELGATVVRYPGGNFVSGYRWEDGVGPVAGRPVRRDAAWHSIETNRFGLHEFVAFAAAAGLEVMPALNLGTRGLASAGELHEYANHPGGTSLSDLRRGNGAEEPFGFRIWCLGNEMDGPWQIGHRTADEYGRLAAETARYLRMLEPSLELVVAGSSTPEMPTFGSWERTVLGHTNGLVDHVSIHAYYEELDGDGASFLASSVALDRYIETVAALVDEVPAVRPDGRPVGIAVDEWNVWYLSRWSAVEQPALHSSGWAEAPRLLENDYNVTDAVVVGSLLISLLRHADRVTVANQAQLVNAIAPIRTEPGGPAWRQTVFHPFALTASLARGRVVAVDVVASSVPTARYGAVPVLDAVATSAADGTVTVFVVNRSLTDEVRLDALVPGVFLDLVTAQCVAAPDGGDRFSVNTADREWVRPRPLDQAWTAAAADGTHLSATLPPVSWTAITLGPAGA